MGKNFFIVDFGVAFSSFVLTGCLSRNAAVTTTYKRGNAAGYDAATTVTCGPLLIFDNCYNCEINNDRRAFFRPNEIDVKANCNNIKVLQVDATNNGDYWHRVLKSNYKTIQERIYEGSNIYTKTWNEGFEKI